MVIQIQNRSGSHADTQETYHLQSSWRLRYHLTRREWRSLPRREGAERAAFTSLSLNSPPPIDELQIGKFGRLVVLVVLFVTIVFAG